MDLDRDGDTDVLTAFAGDDKIAWYENTGGGDFSAQKTITTDAKEAQSVFAADLTGNGDPDVLSASQRDDKVAWYENTGAGSFSEQKIITTEADGAESVYAADLDGDGDTDVLSATSPVSSLFDGEIAWYKNNGDGSSFERKIITRDAQFAKSVFAADLDGDEDPDVLSADDVEITWHKNQGGSFSDQKIVTSEVEDARSVYAADLDGDGDADVLSASAADFSDPKIAWYENTADGTFSSQKVITTEADGAWSVFAADLDGDGDTDVLSASFEDDKIAWYENTGGGSFSDQKTITTKAERARSVFAADLTGNDAPDVLSASEGDFDAESKIAWYENTEGVLPVEMAAFEATVDDGTVRLTWQTAAETANARFEVQRRVASAPGVRTGEGANGGAGAWTTVGSVEGSGTTTEAQSYRFVDEDLPYAADRLDYRLRQVDTDGSAHLSKTVTVERGVTEVELLGTFPNPAQSRATVRYALPEKQDVTVRLYDVLGRQLRTVVQAEQEGRHEQRLNMSDLPSGVYFLRLRAGGQTRTQKLTVVR